ncbi:hypothetical protein [Desulfobulbus alkaliphilus]|uniref:hypothetical protein n=1 Tax=Desulfobulbus alkaliphilus TaxID=869814 RepID=UPI00196335CA|nr:hypothetical protein [Desulfobulbus alkaliphilus]MBM9536977.1 hypothetical protein [Desulfobulbus alkaliphilus]
MDYPVSHTFLVRSRSKTLAGRHVQRYLASNQLITYAEFIVREEEIHNAVDERFQVDLDRGLAANRAFAQLMLDHLKEEGLIHLNQLVDLEQGYATKILHTLTHLLDGFIGIDSAFYNLVEDSHRVSAKLADAIAAEPELYWLVPVRTGEVTVSVLHRVD